MKVESPSRMAEKIRTRDRAARECVATTNKCIDNYVHMHNEQLRKIERKPIFQKAATDPNGCLLPRPKTARKAGPAGQNKLANLARARDEIAQAKTLLRAQREALVKGEGDGVTVVTLMSMIYAQTEKVAGLLCVHPLFEDTLADLDLRESLPDVYPSAPRREALDEDLTQRLKKL